MNENETENKHVKSKSGKLILPWLSCFGRGGAALLPTSTLPALFRSCPQDPEAVFYRVKEGEIWWWAAPSVPIRGARQLEFCPKIKMKKFK